MESGGEEPYIFNLGIRKGRNISFTFRALSPLPREIVNDITGQGAGCGWIGAENCTPTSNP